MQALLLPDAVRKHGMDLTGRVTQVCHNGDTNEAVTLVVANYILRDQTTPLRG